MGDIQLTINGQKLNVPAGTMVAAAVALAGTSTYRHSVLGESRAPLCGHGHLF